MKLIKNVRNYLSGKVLTVHLDGKLVYTNEDGRYKIRTVSESEKNEKLLAAAKQNNMQEVKTFLFSGADITVLYNKEGKIDKEHHPELFTTDKLGEYLIEAIEIGNFNAIDSLIRLGANINYRNNIDHSAIDAAVMKKNPAILSNLIKAGADLNYINKDGFTPLAMNKDPVLAKILIENGADINAKVRDFPTITYISWMCEFSRDNKQKQDCVEILKLLIKSGCDLKPVYANDMALEHELIQEIHGKLVMDALRKKDLKEVAKLLFQGIDISSQEEDKKKIFQLMRNRFTRDRSNFDKLSEANDIEITIGMLQLMIEYKFDVSQFYKNPPNEDHPLLKQIKDEQEPKISKNKRLKFPKIPKSIRVVFSNVTSISPPSFTSYFSQTKTKAAQKDIVSETATANQASVNDTRSNPPKAASILIENVSSAEPIKPSVYSRIKAGIFGKRTNSTFNR